MMDTQNLKIGFIGAGNMAQCIMLGIHESVHLKDSQFWVSAPTEKHLVKLKLRGYNVTHDNMEVVKNCTLIFLCVKPNTVPMVCSEISPILTGEQLLVSVAAGIRISDLKMHLPDYGKVVRCMPNTAMMAKAGVCALCRGPDVGDEKMDLLRTLLESISLCEEVAENLMDAVGGLSGCGPAYVFLMIEGLADGGVKMGLSRTMALQFAAQTVMGSAKLVLESGIHPAELRDNVCSPKGTTIQGVHALEKRCVRAAFMEAVEAATLRSIELGRKHHPQSPQ
ncbi:pyrroline-5-carboxylate reductase 3-like [Ornithodoros turicata]